VNPRNRSSVGAVALGGVGGAAGTWGAFTPAAPVRVRDTSSALDTVANRDQSGTACLLACLASVAAASSSREDGRLISR
jgi:hypothetical protein